MSCEITRRFVEAQQDLKLDLMDCNCLMCFSKDSNRVSSAASQVSKGRKTLAQILEDLKGLLPEKEYKQWENEYNMAEEEVTQVLEKVPIRIIEIERLFEHRSSRKRVPVTDFRASNEKRKMDLREEIAVLEASMKYEERESALKEEKERLKREEQRLRREKQRLLRYRAIDEKKARLKAIDDWDNETRIKSLLERSAKCNSVHMSLLPPCDVKPDVTILCDKSPENMGLVGNLPSTGFDSVLQTEPILDKSCGVDSDHRDVNVPNEHCLPHTGLSGSEKDLMGDQNVLPNLSYTQGDTNGTELSEFGNGGESSYQCDITVNEVAKIMPKCIMYPRPSQKIVNDKSFTQTESVHLDDFNDPANGNVPRISVILLLLLKCFFSCFHMCSKGRMRRRIDVNDEKFDFGVLPVAKRKQSESWKCESACGIVDAACMERSMRALHTEQERSAEGCHVV